LLLLFIIVLESNKNK